MFLKNLTLKKKSENVANFEGFSAKMVPKMVSLNSAKKTESLRKF